MFSTGIVWVVGFGLDVATLFNSEDEEAILLLQLVGIVAKERNGEAVQVCWTHRVSFLVEGRTELLGPTHGLLC